MKTEEFDKKFDKGEDVTKYLDFSKARTSRKRTAESQRGFPHLDDSMPRQRSSAPWSCSAGFDQNGHRSAH